MVSVIVAVCDVRLRLVVPPGAKRVAPVTVAVHGSVIPGPRG